MNPIVDTVSSHWNMGRRTRRSPGGWVSGNACCCAHNGETEDRRGRGGLLITPDQGFVYSCFNCGFTTGWHPGIPFGLKLKNLMRWLNVQDDTITRLQFYALHERDSLIESGVIVEYPEYPSIEMPRGIKYIADATEITDRLNDVLNYMASRNLHELDYPFAYGESGDHAGRLIIPAVYEQKLVGMISRDVSGRSRYRYIKEIPSGFVFNLDRQLNSRDRVYLCEGNLDALYIDGIATMGSEISDQQRMVINGLGKQVVVVPDRDHKGRKLVEQAIDNEWAVSFPNWETGIDDIGDAAVEYGRLYTLYSIAENVHYSKFKIQLQSKMWFGN